GLAPPPAAGRDEQKRPPAAQPKEPDRSGDRVEVRGRVLGPDGKPCAGARLHFVSADADEERPPVVATSGGDGRFRLMSPRPELVRGRQLVAVAAGAGPDWVEADALTRGEVTLRLVADVTISGRVFDLEGQPVKDVRVRVRGLEATPGEDLGPVLKAWNPD